nr:unnamed protein product [Callosobruchus analis]
MVRTCSVCKKRYRPGEDRACHTVPKSPSLRQKWHAVLAKCGISNISADTNVCSDHFIAEDIYVAPAGRKLLRKGAVPSVHLASATVQCTASERSLNGSSVQFLVMATTSDQMWQYPAAKR